jgi:hypothetical protein
LLVHFHRSFPRGIGRARRPSAQDSDRPVVAASAGFFVTNEPPVTPDM